MRAARRGYTGTPPLSLPEIKIGGKAMTTVAASRPGGFNRTWNRFKTYISKPQNAILLMLGIILTITTVAPTGTMAFAARS